MKKLTSITIGLMFSGCAMVAPALATTSDNNDVGDYTKHAMDCLALLFTDPKAHDEQCGGPNFVLPDPPHGSTGFAPCRNISEIDAFGIDGVQYKLEAFPGPVCCVGSLTAPTYWEPLGSKSLVWREPEQIGVVATACPI